MLLSLKSTLISIHMAPAAQKKKKERMLQKKKFSQFDWVEEQTGLLIPRFHVWTIFNPTSHFKSKTSRGTEWISKVCIRDRWWAAIHSKSYMQAFPI